MIEGFKIQMTSVELAAHLWKRFEHHRDRAQYYLDRIEQDADGVFVEAGSSYAPMRESMKNSAHKHTQQAQAFLLRHEHLIEGEVYRLTDGDLYNLEMIER